MFDGWLRSRLWVWSSNDSWIRSYGVTVLRQSSVAWRCEIGITEVRGFGQVEMLYKASWTDCSENTV